MTDYVGFQNPFVLMFDTIFYVQMYILFIVFNHDLRFVLYTQIYERIFSIHLSVSETTPLKSYYLIIV